MAEEGRALKNLPCWRVKITKVVEALGTRSGDQPSPNLESITQRRKDSRVEKI